VLPLFPGFWGIPRKYRKNGGGKTLRPRSVKALNVALVLNIGNINHKIIDTQLSGQTIVVQKLCPFYGIFKTKHHEHEWTTADYL